MLTLCQALGGSSDQMATRRIKGNTFSTSFQSEIHGNVVETQTNKRLFSDRTLTYPTADGDCIDNGTHIDDGPGRSHPQPGKRHRPDDWPLKSHANGNNHYTDIAWKSSNVSMSPPSRRKASYRSRPSRFIEGSMNDRTSKRPPMAYVGLDDNEILEQFTAEQNTHHGNRPGTVNTVTPRSATRATNSLTTGKPDIVKQSTIFRFGRSLASSFIPSNWKIWNRNPQERESLETRTFRDRREKAEAIYEAMKTTGQFETFAHASKHRIKPMESKRKGHEKHDSGIQLQHRGSNVEKAVWDAAQAHSASWHEKRYGRVFLETPIRIPVAGKNDASYLPLAESAIHEEQAQRRSLFTSKRPSLSSLHTGQDTRQPQFEIGQELSIQAVRQPPSRKELQIQQKLVKKVSNLEGKLEAARQQLSRALGESNLNCPSMEGPKAMSRSHFVRGALTTLPSEGWLGAYANSESNGGSTGAFGEASPDILNDTEAISQVQVMTANLEFNNNSPLFLKPSGEDSIAAIDNRATVLPEALFADHGSSKAGDGVEEDDFLVDVTSVASTDTREAQESKSYRLKKRKYMVSHGKKDDGNYRPFLTSEDDSDYGQSEVPRVKRKAGRPGKVRKADRESLAFPDSGRLTVRRSNTPFLSRYRSTSHNSRKAHDLPSPPLPPDLDHLSRTTSPRIALQENSIANTRPNLQPPKSVPLVPRMPNEITVASEKVLEIQNRATQSMMNLPSLDMVDKHGMPCCTACNTKFSSRGRLATHISKACKVLRVSGVYEEKAMADDDKGTLAGDTIAQGESRNASAEQSFEWPDDVF